MWPPRRMRHLLRRASSCLRFSRRRRDASATGEAICVWGLRGAGGGTCCRRGVRDRHSPRSVCNEWRDHRVSAVLAALGSSHPFLEPECALGARGVAGRRKDLDWKLALLVWKRPGLRAASRASAFSLPPMQGKPTQHCQGTGPTLVGSYLHAPTRLCPDCACASRTRVLSPKATEEPGPTTRAAAVSPLRRNRPHFGVRRLRPGLTAGRQLTAPARREPRAKPAGNCS